MGFNQILKSLKIINNHEGAGAYKLSPELELYTAVCTAALQPKFYETHGDLVDRIASLVSKVSPEFVARLAIYARTEMHMRSVPLLLAVELARVHGGDSLVSRTVARIVQRADEIMELLMCYQWRNPQSGRKKLGRLSHQIQAGLQLAFNNFNEYQFAKYNRTNLEVKLRDALFIVHPKAKDAEQQEIFNRIVNNTLQTPYTWETELSALGQVKFDSDSLKREAFAAKWTELANSNKLGYMALMRNLRNIIEAGVDTDTANNIAGRLANPREVARAQQFPFRYLSAYKEISPIGSMNTSTFMSALEDAAMASAANISGFTENTRVMLACDTSGSMNQPISGKSSIKLYEVGIMLAMLLHNRCRHVISGMFATDWKVINLPRSSILSNAVDIRRRLGEVGWGTEGEKPLEWLIEQKIVVDKVMYFTDCQMWGTPNYVPPIQKTWAKYKKIAPDARLYIFDLAGYGTTPIEVARPDVTLLAGWSDSIFDMLHAIEHGSDAISAINAIPI